MSEEEGVPRFGVGTARADEVIERKGGGAQLVIALVRAVINRKVCDAPHIRGRINLLNFKDRMRPDRRRTARLRHLRRGARKRGGSEKAGNYTLYFCTALDLCPGP